MRLWLDVGVGLESWRRSLCFLRTDTLSRWRYEPDTGCWWHLETTVLLGKMSEAITPETFHLLLSVQESGQGQTLPLVVCVSDWTKMDFKVELPLYCLSLRPFCSSSSGGGPVHKAKPCLCCHTDAFPRKINWLCSSNPLPCQTRCHVLRSPRK